MFNQTYYKSALKKIPQRYMLVNVLAKRIRQLQKGAEPLVEVEEKNELISKADIALREIAEGKVWAGETEN